MIRRTYELRQRLGVATLEFAMVFPILLLFFVLIYLVFLYFYRDALLTIDARARSVGPNVKWNREQSPLPVNDVVVNLIKPEKNQYGFIFSTLSRDFSLQAIGEGWVSNKTNYTVLGGSWDHRGIVFKLREASNPIDNRAFWMAMAPPEAVLILLGSVEFLDNGVDPLEILKQEISGAVFGDMQSFADAPKSFLEGLNIDPTKIDDYINESSQVVSKFRAAIRVIDKITSLINSTKGLKDDY